MDLSLPQYIQDWLRILEEMHNVTTYKPAWGKAIIECVRSGDYLQESGYRRIAFYSLAKPILKYYWNQTYFFNLSQESNHKKETSIVQRVRALIQTYQKIQSERGEVAYPEWFTKAETELKRYAPKALEQCLEGIALDLTHDVSWRFKRVNGAELNIYEYREKQAERAIRLTNDQCDLLYAYADLLTPILDYRWSQLLEKYNHAPKICFKVQDASLMEIKRDSQKVAGIRKFLVSCCDGPVTDFYSKQILADKDITADHVIPWSFIYSDDIWNLVLTSRSINSSKNNAKPSFDTIKKLNIRNRELASVLPPSKFKEELLIANQNHYVDKFYREMSC